MDRRKAEHVYSPLTDARRTAKSGNLIGTVSTYVDQ
jgi:hypothetical protein